MPLSLQPPPAPGRLPDAPSQEELVAASILALAQELYAEQAAWWRAELSSEPGAARGVVQGVARLWALAARSLAKCLLVERGLGRFSLSSSGGALLFVPTGPEFAVTAGDQPRAGASAYGCFHWAVSTRRGAPRGVGLVRLR